MGVNFKRHDEICSKLRYLQHTCGNRLQIKYLFERPWSKRSRDHTQKIGSETLSNLDIQIEAIKDEFNNDGFVYLVNKDKEDEVRSQLNILGGEQLPNSPFGLNSYQHLNQAVVLSALNPSPAQYSFLSHMGVDEDAVRESLYHQACYQAIMRTSLRNKDATDPVKIIVSDLGVAKSLQENFPGSEVSSVITRVKEQPKRRIGRPPSASTKSRADTLSETRTRKRRIKQLISDFLAGSTPDTEEIKQIETKCRSDNRDLVQLKVLISSSFSCTSKQQNQLHIPIFRSIYSASPDSGIAVDITEYEAFMKQLQACSKTKLSNKHENALLCTTAFDGSLSNQTKRGLDNITHISGVWLDIDGGVMPRDEIPALFPNIRMAVFNSWSSGNYRIFIPTTEYMSIGTYDEVLQQIVCAVEQQSPDWEIKDAQTAGRKPKCYVGSKQAEKQRKLGKMPNPKHGIDASKMTPSSMFYMPAQCGDDPSKSFFIDYNDDGRAPLNPSEFIKIQHVSVEELEDEYHRLQLDTDSIPQIQHTEFVDQNNAISKLSSHTPQTIIDKAIADYAGVPDGQNRHNAFFAAIHRIHYFGHVPISELTSYMSQCDYDGHQRKRYNGIIKSLQSGRYHPKHKAA